jgi:hypothetical protein
MINCAVCSNTRKVNYEGHIETCPVCEDYLVWGNQDELEDNQERDKAVQNELNRNTRTVDEKTG